MPTTEDLEGKNSVESEEDELFYDSIWNHAIQIYTERVGKKWTRGSKADTHLVKV